MPQPRIIFVLGQGGLVRTLPNSDHVSCLIFEFAQPGSWGTDQIREFRNIQQVEASGILPSDPSFAEVHYHAEEFFRMQPNGGILWINFNLLDTNLIVNKTGGAIRQYAINRLLNAANPNSLQVLMDELAALSAPANILIGCTGVPDIMAVASGDQPRNQNNPNVSQLISGDGDAKGKQLATSLGVPYVPAIGAVLGAISAAQVHESIAWPARFNFAKTELEKILFADGTKYEDMNQGDLDTLHDQGFIFFKKFVGLAGTYANDTHTSTEVTSDYAYIENNRTIQKAVRLVNTAILPQLNSPLYVNDDGTLSDSTVGYFKSLAENPLITQMLNRGELSAVAVNIDASQNVLATSQLEIVIRLVPVGVAREITVKIGFATSIA